MFSRGPAAWPVLLVVLCWLRRAGAFSNGSVSYSCGSLAPGHAPYIASTLAPPYRVIASSSSYRPGDALTVTMETTSSNTTPFQGFMLQARSRAGSGQPQPVGCFTDMNTTLVHTLHCSGMQNSSISHSSNAQKNRIQVTWEAPSTSSHGDIYFCASFVQNYNTFWVGVSSATLKLDSSAEWTTARSQNLLVVTGLIALWTSASP